MRKIYCSGCEDTLEAPGSGDARGIGYVNIYLSSFAEEHSRKTIRLELCESCYPKISKKVIDVIKRNSVKEVAESIK